MTNTFNRLASAAGESNQDLNIELANEIAKSDNLKTIEELIEGLEHPSKAIRHDCIKVLYEIGSLKASLISAHAAVFIQLLQNKDNRMQWGAMTALSSITERVPDQIAEALPALLSIADQGSVITKDHLVKILISLSGNPKYSDTATTLLLEQILKAPNNQLPSYAEQTLTVSLNAQQQAQFKKILQQRVADITPESKKKRVEKVLKKL